MDPNLILILAGVAAAWVVLSVLGNERQRRVQEADSAPKNRPSPVIPAAAKSGSAAGMKALASIPSEKPAH